MTQYRSFAHKIYCQTYNFIYYKIYKKQLFKKKPQRSEQQWCRIVMNQETKKLLENLDCAGMQALEISGEYWQRHPFQSYQKVRYPEYDVCKEALAQKFDIIIAEQVFEHIPYPYRAAKNIFEMLREGGYFLLTTPFLLKYHPCPLDCTRWTETGLQYFLEEAGFDPAKMQTGSWGNRACLIGNLDKWAKYRKYRHSLKNEAEFHVVVWALVQK